MKIAIATAVYYPQINGVAVFSHNLALGLTERGHKVMVICPSQTGKSYTRTVDGVKTVYLRSVDAKIYPDQIHDVPARKRVFGKELPRLIYKRGFKVSVFPQREVKRVLDAFDPDVVHVQVSDPIGLSVVSWARKFGVPVVTTEHNQPEVLTESLKMPKIVRRPANALLYAYFRNRQSKSDFVTMPTKLAIHNLLSRGELKVPIAAVSNGVNLTYFNPGPAKTEIYKKYGLSLDAPTVLYVGRVDPEKQVETVIRAFKQARRKISNAELLIVGDGVDKARLEGIYGVKDGVRFLGRTLPPDLYEIYRVGWVFATASEVETQGIVLIEAAASGLPLIAVNKGAAPEVCVDKISGYLCRPKNVDDMAEAMVTILSDANLRRELAMGAVKIALENDFEKTLDKFINIYNKVIQSRAAN